MWSNHDDDDYHPDHDTAMDAMQDVIFYIGILLAILWCGNYIDGLLT